MEDAVEGAQFLKQKYDFHNAPEVDQAARRAFAHTGEKIPQDPLARIQNYLSRFTEITEREDPDRKEHGVEALKRVLYSRCVIKPDEVPEGYFENQRRLAREQGHGDVEITRQMRDQLTEVVIADQRSSLDTWVDYLASDDAPYPIWLKYWSVRSIVNMGPYDKEKHTFPKRSTGTTKPFPDLNREALSYVLDAVNKKYQGQRATFAALDEHGQQELDRLLQGENFSKLYGWAIDKVTPASEEQLAATNGSWVRYAQGADHVPLFTSLQGHGTGWCTAGESTAQAQLQGGDFYVYYSLDATGNPTVPRAAIRMEGDHIAEVRGVAPEQNLDAHIAPVVQSKLKEFPDGTAYEKRAHDMQLLTDIEHRATAGQSLTKDDLIFLYEIDGAIDGFGYGKDPRIEELRSTRNPREDAPIVLDCQPSQIAWRVEDVREDTKAYVGPLFPGVFDKLRTIDHIYTSFPEGRIARETLEIGGQTKEELERELRDNQVEISTYAEDMFRNPAFVTPADQEAVDIIRLKVGDLGFTNYATTQQLFERIKEYGLELVPPEVGPRYRLAHMDQPVGDWVYMGMEPITGRRGDPDVFRVERSEGRRWLHRTWADPDSEWAPRSKFVFRLRKLETSDS